MDKDIKVEMKEHYLEVSLKGDIEFSDYFELLQGVGTQKDLPKKLRVLGIDNGLNIKFSPSDTLKLADVRKQTIEQFEDVKHAYVVDDPMNTALAVLTTSETQSPNYSVKIFSSKKAALDWLLE